MRERLYVSRSLPSGIGLHKVCVRKRSKTHSLKLVLNPKVCVRSKMTSLPSGAFLKSTSMEKNNIEVDYQMFPPEKGKRNFLQEITRFL